MNIAEIGRRSKEMLAKVPMDALLVGILILSSTASFSLGMLTEREGKKGSDYALQYPSRGAEGATPVTVPQGGKYVASKNGTKYHLPTCSGAKTISEANKIWFATKEEAEAAGYTPAANCKGI